MSDMKVKPLFVVKPDTIKREDIERAEKEASIVIIECADPESVRFLDAPFDAQIDLQARAALQLMRVVATSASTNYNRDWLVTWFVNALMRESHPEAIKRVEKVKR